MASLQTRLTAAGIPRYRVVWREPGAATPSSRTFQDEDNALTFKSFLDANHNTLALATEARERVDSTAPLVQDLVTRHIDTLRKPQDDTIAKYRRHAATHITGTRLGLTPADKLKPEHVAQWLDSLVSPGVGTRVPKGQPLADKSKRNIHALLSSALKTELAREEPCITRNVAARMTRGERGEGREPYYITPDELDMLIAEVPERWRLMLQVLGFTGLRFNEASALRRRDLTFDADGRATVHVVRAYKDGMSGDVVGLPKTSKSRRHIAADRDLSVALQEHAASLEDDALLFREPSGRRVDNSRFHKLAWQPLMRRLVEEGRMPRAAWVHELRKAHTTHLLLAGVPVHIVQARLGHEDPQTTLKIYAQMTRTDDVAAADALLRGAAPEPETLAAGGSDPLEALRSLAELHGAGVITDEEFAGKKAELLARV